VRSEVIGDRAGNPQVDRVGCLDPVDVVAVDRSVAFLGVVGVVDS
jgi:hypothetical protein